MLALVRRRRGLVFWAAAFAEIPALTAKQAYSGGAGSGYSVLVIMAMVWFGLQATDLELAAGMAVLAASCALPMILIGPPAYPVSWGHGILLVLVGVTVAGALRAVVRELNDEYGHEQGDQALRDSAERIRATLRAGDVVARLGGDEFVALLTNSTLTGSLAAIERLREATPARESLLVGHRGVGPQGGPDRAAAPLGPRAVRGQGGRRRSHRGGAATARAAAHAAVRCGAA